MKKLTAFILCFLLFLTPMLVSAAEYEEETVYATENVNIRTKPTTESEKVALLKKGESITRIGEADGWSKVIYEGEKRYITSEYLSLTPPEEKPAEVTTEELTVYFGPDKKYRSMYTIPKGRRIYEKGYMDGNNNWMYIEDGLTTGWIEAYDEENDVRNVEFEVYPAKPVIYLYPEQETDVHVELELTEAELSTTYPKYNNGWDVTAYPDGTLINKADGTHHKYLFWDAKNCRTRFDYSKGFCVAGSDTEQFLKEKLTYMGLTEEEMNEFIVYWLPLMEHNAYNFITFQDDEYTDSAKLNITPTPDSICRIFMVYVPLEDAVSVEPQELETFERNGFTVVEWGGAEINANINS